MPTPDQTDWKIIDVLKENSRLSSSKISKKTGIPITTVFNRMKKLEKERIIKNYTVVVDEKKLGNIITAYIFLHYNISVWGKGTDREELRKQLRALPRVEEIKYITGRFDIMLKVRAPDMDFLNDFILAQLRKIKGVGQTETFFVMEEVR